MRSNLGESGSVSLPLGIACGILALGSIGAIGLMRHWRSQVEIQLSLDRCVAQTSIQLRNLMNSIERDNGRIEKTRDAIVAAAESGAIQGVLRAVLSGLIMHQEIERARWEARRAEWGIKRGCDGHGSLLQQLPSMGWIRPPDDFIGPRPLERPDESSLRIQLGYSNRQAAAEIEETDGNGGLFDSNTWRAHWAPPGFAIRASAH